MLDANVVDRAGERYTGRQLAIELRSELRLEAVELLPDGEASVAGRLIERAMNARRAERRLDARHLAAALERVAKIRDQHRARRRIIADGADEIDRAGHASFDAHLHDSRVVDAPHRDVANGDAL